MGSRRAAWRAGQTPKTTPTTTLKPTAAAIVIGLNATAQPARVEMSDGDEEADDDPDRARRGARSSAPR